MKILIIEDDHFFNEDISFQLEDEGYMTTISTDGDVLISDINKTHDFDIIILDMMFRLPSSVLNYDEFLAGVFMIKKIRNISDIPIIVISARHYSAVMDDIDMYNHIHYFTKPLDSENLKNILELLKEVETTLPNNV